MAFDPSQPFETVEDSAPPKSGFDPSQPFQSITEDEASALLREKVAADMEEGFRVQEATLPQPGTGLRPGEMADSFHPSSITIPRRFAADGQGFVEIAPTEQEIADAMQYQRGDTPIVNLPMLEGDQFAGSNAVVRAINSFTTPSSLSMLGMAAAGGAIGVPARLIAAGFTADMGKHLFSESLPAVSESVAQTGWTSPETGAALAEGGVTGLMTAGAAGHALNGRPLGGREAGSMAQALREKLLAPQEMAGELRQNVRVAEVDAMASELISKIKPPEISKGDVDNALAEMLGIPPNETATVTEPINEQTKTESVPGLQTTAEAVQLPAEEVATPPSEPAQIQDETAATGPAEQSGLVEAVSGPDAVQEVPSPKSINDTANPFFDRLRKAKEKEALSKELGNKELEDEAASERRRAEDDLIERFGTDSEVQIQETVSDRIKRGTHEWVDGEGLRKLQTKVEAAAAPEIAPQKEAAVEPVPPASEEAPDAFDLQSWIQENKPQEESASRYLSPSAQYAFHKKVWEAAGRPEINTESAYTGGPGAMGPVEAGEMAASGKTTSLKKAVVKDERLARALQDLPPEARQSEEARVQRAEDVVDKDPTAAPNLVSRIVDTGDRKISADEAAVLLVERTRLMNERTKWEESRGENGATPDQRAAAEVKLTDIEQQMERLDVAQRAAGSEWGRTGRMYQQMMREDFTLESLERQARAEKGGPLTGEERAKLKEQSEKILELQKKLEAEEAAAAELQTKADRAAILEATIEDLRKQDAGRPKYGQAVLDRAEQIVQTLEKRAEEAGARLRKRLGRTSAGIDPTILLDVAEIIAAKIGRLGLTFTEASRDIIAEFGNEIEPYLQKAWVKANQIIRRTGGTPPVKKVIEEGVSKPKKGEKTTADIAARAKAEATAGLDLSSKTAYEAVRAVINSGVKGETQIMQGAMDLLKPSFPELTPNQLDVAFSEYGKAKFPSQDADKQLLSKMRRLRQMQAAIDDVKETGETKKSGLQRAKPDADVRQRQAELKAAIEEFGKDVPQSEEQLANREKARITAAKNAIEDLDRELKTGEARIKSEPKMPSVELEQLQAELAAMRQLKREIQDAKKPEPPPEHVQELNRLQDRADVLRDKLARLDLASAPKKSTVDTPEIAAVKEEIKQLTETISELRKPIPKSDSDKQVEALTKQKQKLDDVLSGNANPTTPKQWSALSDAAADIKAEILAMQELAAQMRRDAKPKKDPEHAREQARIKALEGAIARYSQRTAASDFSAPPKIQGPDTRRVAALKEVLESRRAAYRAARDAGKPVLTEEEQYSATRLKSLERQMKEAETRIKNKDYAVRPKKVQPAKNQKVLDAEIELDKLKQEILKGRYEMMLANRTVGKKIWDGIQSARGAYVNIKSSFDLSAPRQALWALLSHVGRSATSPVASAKMVGNAFGKMFKAVKTEQDALRIEKAREKRPNAVSGAYKLAGVSFTDLETKQFTKFEENAHSILDQWASEDFKTGKPIKDVLRAPQRAGARIVRISNRAFITFLNETRADLFDELTRINFQDRPPTVDELKIIGNYVNIATGRGKLKPDRAKFMAEFLWAPRLLASRVQILTGQPLWTGEWKDSARARGIVAKEYARAIAGGFLLLAVSRLFDEKQEDDPTSSDFGKIVRGDTRVDVWGGLQQPVVFMSRGLTATRKSLSGEVKDIGADRPFGVNGPAVMMLDFARSKLRPEVGAFLNAFDRRNFVGEKVGVKETLKALVPVPLPLQDVAKIMRSNGFTEGMILQALGMFGAGVQNYSSEEEVNVSLRPSR